MRTVLAVAALGVALWTVSLGLRSALAGGVLPRLLGVRADLGGAQVLPRASSGASVAGDLR